ncbi:MAG: Tol-Pal system beta propeller repeat protein TolB [Methylophilaceae bacterium 17-44-8]|jgi:TolB protein|nr:MAG: Tol-Pal system beta propeller repeat protein TolB [Methylophilaceae bacterium 17-44-8]
MKVISNSIISLLMLAVSFLASTQANAALEIEISGGGAQQIPVAILPFAEPAGISSKDSIHEIVAADLKRSGMFRVLDTRGMANLPTSPNQIKYAEWSALQAQAMTVGTVESLGGGRFKVTFQLMDVLKQTQLIGMDYQITSSQVRATAHKIADAIYEKLTGERGVFGSRIAYINKIGKRYTLQVSDADGFNAQNVVSSNEPIISPAWSPDGSKMAYVSFEKKKPIVYVQSLTSGARKVLANYKGNNSAPSWSPDGSKLAIVLTYGANSQIYIIDADGGNLKQVTKSNAIDTEPAYSPDGKFIYFSSDRGGKPQIYKVPASGGDATRVTFEGAYNVSPHFSPDGRYLTYIRNDGGKFKVALQDLSNGQVQLLSEGSQDESPSFSPNGRVILYATKVRGRGTLAAVSSDGRVRQKLSESTGDVREPAWAPLAK